MREAQCRDLFLDRYVIGSETALSFMVGERTEELLFTVRGVNQLGRGVHILAHEFFTLCHGAWECFCAFEHVCV